MGEITQRSPSLTPARLAQPDIAPADKERSVRLARSGRSTTSLERSATLRAPKHAAEAVAPITLNTPTERLFGEATEACGTVNILMNNAGVDASGAQVAQPYQVSTLSARARAVLGAPDPAT